MPYTICRADPHTESKVKQKERKAVASQDYIQHYLTSDTQTSQQKQKPFQETWKQKQYCVKQFRSTVLPK